MTIASIRARVEKATPGLWTAEYSAWESEVMVDDGSIAETCYRDDADFIAHARQDIPALLKVAEAAKRMHDANAPMSPELIFAVRELEAGE